MILYTCPLVCQTCIHLNDGYPGYHSPTIHLGLPDFDGSSYTQKTPCPKVMHGASTFSSDVSSSALDDVRSRWVDLQDSKQNKELICFGQARFIQLIESIILMCVGCLRQHTIHLYPDGKIMNRGSTSLHATGSYSESRTNLTFFMLTQDSGPMFRAASEPTTCCPVCE